MVKLNKKVIGGELMKEEDIENIDQEPKNIVSETNPCKECCNSACNINEEWEEDT